MSEMVLSQGGAQCADDLLSMMSNVEMVQPSPAYKCAVTYSKFVSIPVETEPFAYLLSFHPVVAMFLPLLTSMRTLLTILLSLI